MTYGKFFASTFTGSMAGAGATVFAVWGYCLANGAGGQVDLNPLVVSALIGCPLSDVRDAIGFLCEPDSNSRSKTHDGRRLLHLTGVVYEIVNHTTYRAMATQESVREYHRERKRAQRVVPDCPGQVRENSASASVSGSVSGSDPDPEGELEGVTVVNPQRGLFAPEDFAPNEAHAVRCQELKLDVAEQVRMFKLHEFNRPYSDWPRRFGKWLEESKVRRETDQAKAIAAAQRPRQGFGAPVLVLSPNTKHRAFAEAQGIDLDALIRKMVDEQLVQKLGLGRAREIIGERLVAAAKKRKANNVNRTP